MVFKHSHLEFQQRCLVGQLAPCIFLVRYTAERKKTKHFEYYDIYSSINHRTYIGSCVHAKSYPHRGTRGGRRWMDPP